ncbi:GGDEF domain-containing protein [Defluviitalea phaphyphila]|uniref:GGDEF domain-containing protein n=1 Tax=Defluviitalea phaphyphila TaxID=1473580 RepID=UPI000731D0A4|nr:GGDEF domain-containing protein [Defluviitalea phaphyphila]
MKLKKSLLALALFLLLYCILGFLPRPSGYVLDTWNLKIGDNIQKINIPYYQIIDKPDTAIFQTTFSMPEGNTLVIPQISCYAFAVRVNGILVDQVGDLENPTANIWNYAHIINLDRNILKDKNEIIIEAHLLDSVGMNIAPFIDETDNVLKRISLFNFINIDMHLIMIGISISIAFIMMSISYYNKAEKGKFFYLGLSVILISIYSFDNHYRLYSGNIDDFLFIRKILFSFAYLTLIFLILGIEKFVGKIFYLKKIIFSSIIISIILVLSSSNFTSLRIRTNFLNLVMFISLVMMLIFLARYKKGNWYFSNMFLTISVGYTAITLFFKIKAPYLFHYGLMVYFIGLGISLIVEFYNMYNEKKQIYQKSLVDHLTKAYNRNVLEEMNIAEGDILILVDVDNFKKYNDTRGHSMGDLLLKQIVNIAKFYIKEKGNIIRYGGDEFLIVLNGVSYFDAENIMHSIRNEIINKCKDKEIDISFGIAEYKGDFSSSFDEADRLMYEMKKKNSHS